MIEPQDLEQMIQARLLTRDEARFVAAVQAAEEACRRNAAAAQTLVAMMESLIGVLDNCGPEGLASLVNASIRTHIEGSRKVVAVADKMYRATKGMPQVILDECLRRRTAGGATH